MSYEPQVSVILPVYNAEATLKKCLDSLLAVDYPAEKLEIVAVDNASTDATPAILAGYAEKIRVVREKKRGPAAARNRGVAEATGEVLALVDSDCEVDPGWVSHLVRPLEDEQVGVVGGCILSKRPCNYVEEFGEKIHDHDKAINLFKPGYVITMNWASRRLTTEKLGFDENFIRGEDADLARRFLQAGYRFAYAADAIIYHRNERTLRGLFHEGFLHGVWGVRVNKVHADFAKSFGHRRFNWGSYTRILGHWKRWVTGPTRAESLCAAIFETGKKLGKFVGSVRFGYLEW